MSFSRQRQRSVQPAGPALLLVLSWAAHVLCPLGCAPGCRPLPGTAYQYDEHAGSAALLLDWGGCYVASSADSTPCLVVPPQGLGGRSLGLPSSTTTVTTWSPSQLQQQQQQQPIVDLCNQVQSIWLAQGVHAARCTADPISIPPVIMQEG